MERKEIPYVDGKQSAKIIAITGFFVMVIFALFGLIALLAGWSTEVSELRYVGLAYVLLPFLYIPIVYLVMRFYFWIYNKCAARWGGIVFGMREKENTP
jgi:fatty acid desaturase